MLSYRFPLVAREGWLFVALCLLGGGVLHYYAGVTYAIPVWLVGVILVVLFRDPPRHIPASPLAVVSPVDSMVVAITSVQDGYVDRPAKCISLKMSILGVYSVRSPIEGKVKNQWFDAENKISPTSGRKLVYAQWVRTDEGGDVVLVMERGALLQTPKLYAPCGGRVGQGQRCGFIHFGTCVHVLIPANARINVAAGDHIKAGTDIIAYFANS